MKISRKTIADMAGVSPTTVSCVLNNTRPVSKKIREKVMKVVEQYQYIPDVAARAMVNKGSKQVCIIMNDLKNPFLAELVDGFESTGIEKGYFVSICGKMDMPKYINHILARKVDGVYFCTEIKDDDYEYIHTLLENGIKVLTNLKFDHYTDIVSRVDMQTYQATVDGLDYLRKMGHCKIAYLTIFSNDDDFDDRLSAFKNTMKACGVDNPVYHLPEVTLPAELNSGRLLFDEFYHTDPDVTAVMCTNDLIAIGAMQEAQRLGLRVPEDISFMGMDGIEIASLVTPKLTTVKSDAAALGAKAFDMLYDLIVHDRVETYNHPLTLLEQESVSDLTK